MTLATARAQLRDVLAPALPDFDIFPDVEPVDEITSRTLVLIRTRVEKLPTAPMGAWQNTIALWVIVPKDAGEDALDEALEEVLEALDEVSQTRWDSADREVWNDSAPAYAITLTTASIRS